MLPEEGDLKVGNKRCFYKYSFPQNSYGNVEVWTKEKFSEEDAWEISTHLGRHPAGYGLYKFTTSFDNECELYHSVWTVGNTCE